MKRVKLILFCALLLLALTGCTFQNKGSSGKTEDTALSSGAGEEDPFRISLGSGEILLETPGEYTLSGSSTDARIRVDCPGEVTLRFENAGLVSLSGPAIKVSQAESLTIFAAEGSENLIRSGEEAALVPVDEHTGAVIQAKCDLRIEGSGALSIEGYINNGIDCDAAVRVACGELSLKAANNGIKANALILDDGSIAVEAGDEGIKAYDTLRVNGGELSVNAAGHCVRSGGEVLINKGTLRLSSPDSRGIYADGAIRIKDGSIDTDVLDDGLFSLTELTVEGGTLNICAGGDGLKAGGSKGSREAMTYINGGDIFISAYGDPVDANGGTVINGGKLFGLGISDGLKGFAPSSAQRWITAFTVGAKGDKVEVTEENAVLESADARYGFNTVLYSAPDMSEGDIYTLSCAGELSISCTA